MIGNKFGKAKFFRQRGDCCLFFRVLSVVFDTGTTAQMEVTWCRKMNNGWKEISTESTYIREKEYNNWVAYQPYGEKMK